MGLYSYRIVLPGYGATPWVDWSTTPAAQLIAEKKQPVAKVIPARDLPVGVTDRRGVDVSAMLPLGPPRLEPREMTGLAELIASNEGLNEGDGRPWNI